MYKNLLKYNIYCIGDRDEKDYEKKCEKNSKSNYYIDYYFMYMCSNKWKQK